MLKPFFFVTGFISLALGVIGIFLPLLPTTPFLLLSAWCFLKSSPKAHQWLYNQPSLGKSLRDWEKNKSIARSTKVVAVSMIVISLVVIWLNAIYIGVQVGVSILLCTISVFILTRPER